MPADTTTTDAPTQAQRWLGLTAIEWCLASTMLLVLLVTGLPRLMMVTATRNEQAVQQELDRFHIAQRNVYNNSKFYAKPSELTGLEPFMGGVRGPDMLGQNWAQAAIGQAFSLPRGYDALFLLDDGRKHWALISWPREHATSGNMSFIITQAGQVWQADLGQQSDGTTIAQQIWGNLATASSAANSQLPAPWQRRAW